MEELSEYFQVYTFQENVRFESWRWREKGKEKEREGEKEGWKGWKREKGVKVGETNHCRERQGRREVRIQRVVDKGENEEGRR